MVYRKEPVVLHEVTTRAGPRASWRLQTKNIALEKSGRLRYSYGRGVRVVLERRCVAMTGLFHITQGEATELFPCPTR